MFPTVCSSTALAATPAPPINPASAPPPTLTSVNGMLRVTLPSPLSQKQVRELRRLCRKTANRAQFDRRLIQIRQIASIAAMGAPSASLFDPATPCSGQLLREWVEFHRAQGADWRDERPLPSEQVGELRRWDRALKDWAHLRFDNVPSASTHLEQHAQLANPATPLVPKRRQSLSEYTQFSSPVSPDVALSSLSSPPPAPVTPAYGTLPLYATPSPPPRPARQALDREPAAHVSISRDGDTINITVPTLPLTAGDSPTDPATCQLATPASDQENLHPATRPLVHAANTAKSWRNAAVGRDNVYQTTAKALFGTKGVQRSDMDWGKLRRPALRALDPNSES